MATQAIAAQGLMGVGRGTERVAPREQARLAAEHNARMLAAQLRARRGPTPEALFVKHIDNSRLQKMADPARAREMRTFACAMAVLLSLLLIYGWQHFSAIEYGYRIATERQQLQQMEEQNRELTLTQAQLASPERIDALAQQLGLAAPQPGQVVLPNAETSGNTAVMAEVTVPGIPANQ
ncbi:MAG TPA: hypothetical protein VME18_09565 [Acidobacteriaceae bacterium]|nr:hypothetical protein [Acidobacteriaceae bacterium]